MKNHLFLIITILLLTFTFSSCSNHYNDSIEWMDSIEVGTTIDQIKNDKPQFIEIGWNSPDTVENEIHYPVTKISGSKDLLSMSHSLVLIDNKFVRRDSHK